MQVRPGVWVLLGDDADEEAWLADQWRLTDEDKAYERGGSEE